MAMFLSLTHWLRDYKMASDLRLSRKAGACPDALATYTGYERTPPLSKCKEIHLF